MKLWKKVDIFFASLSGLLNGQAMTNRHCSYCGVVLPVWTSCKAQVGGGDSSLREASVVLGWVGRPWDGCSCGVTPSASVRVTLQACSHTALPLFHSRSDPGWIL